MTEFIFITKNNSGNDDTKAHRSENDFEWQVKAMRYHENLRINDSSYIAKAFTDYTSEEKYVHV